MTRRVKCQDTGEYLDKDIAYKGANGRYWSSEAVYLKWEDNKEWKKKCMDLLYEILGYEEGMIVPSVFFTRIAKYQTMRYEVVYATIEGERSNIEWALQHKDFKSESGKISYIYRILENHMMDYYKAAKSAKKQNKAKAEIPEDITVENKKQATKDISRFLED